MTNPEQVFYVKYDVNNGYLLGQLTQNGYSKLSDDNKKNYTQVIVDQQHLNGWGKYWPTVRYVNGVLDYPNNWPADQSEQISNLSSQVKQLVANNQTSNQNAQQLQKQLTQANTKATNLTKVVMNLQLALAKAQQGGKKND